MDVLKFLSVEIFYKYILPYAPLAQNCACMRSKHLPVVFVAAVYFFAILAPVWSHSTTTNLMPHPRDQIALQLGAIQMAYGVPFVLSGNVSAQKMQQAANALVMGRNALDARNSGQ